MKPQKIALVTGSSRGIGKATAIKVAQEGFDVAVNYHSDAASANSVVEQIEALGRRAVAIQADVSDENQVDHLFKEVDDRLGTLTALVNNAGTVIKTQTPIEDVDSERLVTMFSTNVFSCFYCCKQAVLRMSTKHGGEGGAIVNVASTAARRGSPGEYIDYASSKAAVETLTLGLSKEVGPNGIRVNTISPGLTDTDIQPPGRLEKLAPNIPMKRAGQPEEIANAIVWLLDKDASFVNGATLDVSGGY